MNRQTPLPVTIVTGFLGSGKTTLLNHILQSQQEQKIAVLVNDFGDINIDSQLLVSVEEDVIALSNGCICCTINEGLVNAVHKVLESTPAVDHAVIETSGVADPLPLLTTFIGSDLRDSTRLDSILTLIDAQNFNSTLLESDTAFNQVAYGDILLLNKTDGASNEKIEQLKAEIERIKPGARILQTQYAQVPLSLILDVGVASSPSLKSASLQSSPLSTHLEKDEFVSVSFESDRAFQLERFQTFIHDQLPENVFRGKGLLWFQGSKLRHRFQLSGKRCEFQTDAWKQTPRNQVVLIGRNLDTSQLKQQLAACLVPNET